MNANVQPVPVPPVPVAGKQPATGYAEKRLVGVRGRDNPPLRFNRQLKPGGRAVAQYEDTSMRRMNKR